MSNLIPIEQLIQSQETSLRLKKMLKIPRIGVLIAEARLSMHDSLSRTLIDEPGIHIVAAMDNAMEAILKTIALKPDVVLVDITLPDNGGLLAIINIKQKLPGVHILVRNLADSDSDLIQALRFGAQGYIPLNAGVGDIIKIIDRVARGEAVLNTDLVKVLVEEFQQRPEDWRSLSSVEKEVLKLCLEKFNESTIAHSLFISENLVREFLYRFLEKLHRRNRIEALAYLQLGHLTLD